MADTSPILLMAVIILGLLNLFLLLKKRGESPLEPRLKEVATAILKFDTILGKTEESIKNEFQRNRTEINEISKGDREELGKTLSTFEGRFSNNVKGLGDGVEKQLRYMREDNSNQLAEMRRTVDERLQTALEKRLGESFKQVSERLELVHKGLGEMQTLAIGVGDLKKVLSNVKTRGIIGEYQLGNILEQIFSPNQYAKNVVTKKGSRANIEYAIKYPGNSPGQHIWLPIDAKFPQEDYNRLIDAYDVGDVGEIEIQRKNLLKTIETFAKDIGDKYIDPPNTTDFAIMFLPVEGLYAEVLRHPGLVEVLQRDYSIALTGPTTLFALLNSYNNGFRALAIEKRGKEVWHVLDGVRGEFAKFSEHLSKVHRQISTAKESLETLQSTRTTAIERKLRAVDGIKYIETNDVISLPEKSDDPSS